MQKETKFENWIQKSIEGEKGFEIVYCNNGEWRWRAENYKDDIVSLVIVLWRNQEIKFTYVWDRDKEKISNEQNELKFVIKSNKKLMLFDGINEIFTFGFENDVENDESIMIFYQHEESGSFIVASTKAPEIRMERYLKNHDIDAMKVFVELICSRLIKAPLVESGVDEIE